MKQLKKNNKKNNNNNNNKNPRYHTGFSRGPGRFFFPFLHELTFND